MRGLQAFMHVHGRLLSWLNMHGAGRACRVETLHGYGTIESTPLLLRVVHILRPPGFAWPTMAIGPGIHEMIEKLRLPPTSTRSS